MTLGINLYEKLWYRRLPDSGRFSFFELRRGQSQLKIAFSPVIGPAAAFTKQLKTVAAGYLTQQRALIKAWASRQAAFLSSLEPLESHPAAPPIIAEMLLAGQAAGVGPMAAVAGALAEAVGRRLQAEFSLDEIVVENGGDLWLSIQKPLAVLVYAGLSSFSGRLAVELDPALSPCGLACSSAKVGPSLSFGQADAALVLASGSDNPQGAAALADAWATALGNRIKTRANLQPAVELVLAAAGTEPRPYGALAILADSLAAVGSLRLLPVTKQL